MRTIIDGLDFPEGPRWRDGALWFSDIHGGAIHRLTGDDDEVVAELDEQPSGLGWLPGGDLLVVCMKTDRVARIDASGSIRTHADLSPWLAGSPNDMIVRDDGLAYVGDMGARIFEAGADHLSPGKVLAVDPSGAVRVAAADLAAPNGLILDPSESHLIVAESAGLCLTTFDVQADGSLANARRSAPLPPAAPGGFAAPDGIALDAEGGVWVADPLGRRVFRLARSGEVTDEHALPELTPVACVLGGTDRATLFVCAARGWTPAEVAGARSGRILAVDVAIPGAGKP